MLFRSVEFSNMQEVKLIFKMLANYHILSKNLVKDVTESKDLINEFEEYIKNIIEIRNIVEKYKVKNEFDNIEMITGEKKEIQRQNAETVPVDVVERETARMCNAFRVALEALPRSLPQKLAGADEVTIQETLAKAVNDALGQLHTKEWDVQNEPNPGK